MHKFHFLFQRTPRKFYTMLMFKYMRERVLYYLFMITCLI